ncbi:hypothetical protein AB1Y20_008449 [Prymnesium parvum]|uniref:PDZ domain-containing protein n=1 Tax=Prymnesium parvum TaxID=97485 RepID=A0AB34IT65_PRYPA
MSEDESSALAHSAHVGGMPAISTPTFSRTLDDDTHRVTLLKPVIDCSLGIRFIDPLSEADPRLLNGDGSVRTIVARLVAGSLAEKVLQPGDEVISINGVPVNGPSEAAATLRGAEGYIRLDVLHGALTVLPCLDSPGKSEESDDVSSLAGTDMSRTEDSSYDDERLATGEAKKPSSASGSSSSTPRDLSAHPFRLELPLPQLSPTSLAVTGIKGHIRLNAKGSSRRLLRRKSAHDNPDESITARVRKLGAMLSPRA